MDKLDRLKVQLSQAEQALEKAERDADAAWVRLRNARDDEEEYGWRVREAREKVWDLKTQLEEEKTSGEA